jgi:hypothetical protein
MARREQTEEVRVYTYDYNGPIANVELVESQAFAAHRYYNKLVEIERVRRQAYESARERHCPGFAAAEAAIAEMDERLAALRKEIKVDKSAARTRKVDPQKAQQLKELQSERKPFYEVLKAKRVAFKEMLASGNAEYDRRYDAVVGDSKDVHLMVSANDKTLVEMLAEPEWHEAWKEVARADGEAKNGSKRARAESGLMKGTYDLVDAAFTAAKKDAKAPPTFHRWEGSGRVGVRVCVTVDDVVGATDGNLRIDALPPETWDSRRGRRKAFTKAALTLGRGTEPVVVPFVMHRPLPEGGTIRAAWIRMRRVGLRKVYSLQLTVAGGTPWKRIGSAAPPKLAKAVAVNFGWRLVGEGLRVAYWVGTDGRSGQIVVPNTPHRQEHSLLERLDYPDVLRGIQDRVFNAARDNLVNERKAGTLPPWPSQQDGSDQLQHVHAWRSPGKMAAYARWLAGQLGGRERFKELWDVWRRERLAKTGDERELFVSVDTIDGWAQEHGLATRLERFAFYLECWSRKDAHLYQWLSNGRERALLHRREIFRIAARRLEREYDMLVMEDFDMRETAKRPKAEEQDESYEIARRRRKQAAPSELRGALKLAFGGHRSTVVDATNNSRAHHVCDTELQGTDQGVMLRCEHCRQDVERDENNCLNQLAKAGYGGETAKAAE